MDGTYIKNTMLGEKIHFDKFHVSRINLNTFYYDNILLLGIKKISDKNKWLSYSQ